MANLPILQFEEKILETVERNPVVVIIGETGSGKSTQLSQMIHKRGYTKSGAIAVTQPRRVAAVSVSRRVAQELGVRLGEEVGYAIRFEDRTSEKTCIKYLTDGVLLRESLSNPELNQYSVIILDEAHERSLNTDILLGLMRRLIKKRSSNLKVLITSATLDVQNAQKAYLESSFKTAIDIHVKEPEGDILIFMTGQDDIDKLVKKLEERVQSLEEGSCMDAIILPLHGSLPPEMQVRVFSPPPPNCRRFIVATNIAETSLTVDGVVVQADQRAGRAGRTRPGKCYRLYPSTVYHEELLDATVPEIQRSSLAGSVLYLKSLDLPDMNILKFGFLDPPSSESLEDALKQLFLIDAIDENGSITSIGRTMAELPLEPSLSRTLMEANEYGCIIPGFDGCCYAISGNHVAGWSKQEHGRRRGSMTLLRTFLMVLVGVITSNCCRSMRFGIRPTMIWSGVKTTTCRTSRVVRGMKFVRDVRKQLSQIMQKIAKGSLDVQMKERWKESREDYRKLRKALTVGYASQLAERMIRHNGYRTLGFKPQLVQVHPSCVLRIDDEGMLPNYVVYHELISTSRPFMRNVCAVEIPWVLPILKKLEKLNINRLSLKSKLREKSRACRRKDVDTARPPDDRDSRIQAARERFLARKTKS
ncbi:RNA helicase family protein [Actinidia rufa]|uniref:RNA helicase n=1 Tax=Actinidia rufa TaxID=165716 RepID=A0A7J0FP90_9ERIC|nr:RNA helicase family protein [Actinidia rufa]